MILSKSKYHSTRSVVKLWLEENPGKDLTREISKIAVATHCPIIIVVEYVMEIVGRTVELEARQESLMAYYGDELGE